MSTSDYRKHCTGRHEARAHFLSLNSCCMSYWGYSSPLKIVMPFLPQKSLERWMHMKYILFATFMYIQDTTKKYLSESKGSISSKMKRTSVVPISLTTLVPGSLKLSSV